MPYQDGKLVEEPSISAWEARHGVRLPEDYRSFILRTNGGALRPYTFHAADPRLVDEYHGLKWLFDWRNVLKKSQETIAPERRNTPPDHLAIGATPSELILMLSLRGDDFGTVVLWPKDLFHTWGEDPNTFVVPLAQSFSALLDALHAREGEYLSYWDGPRSTPRATRITL